MSLRLRLGGFSITLESDLVMLRTPVGRFGVHSDLLPNECTREFDAPRRVYIQMGPLGSVIAGERTQAWTPLRGWRGGRWDVVTYTPPRALQCQELVDDQGSICGALVHHPGEHATYAFDDARYQGEAWIGGGAAYLFEDDDTAGADPDPIAPIRARRIGPSRGDLPLFCYGSLMYPDTLEALLGRVPAMYEGVAAGWSVVALEGVAYPGMVARADFVAPGVVLEGLSEDERALLDAFENEWYDVVSVGVEVERDGERTTIEAAAYVLGPDSGARYNASWDREVLESVLDAYVAGCVRFRERYLASPGPNVVSIRRVQPEDGPVLRGLRLAMLAGEPLAFNVDPAITLGRDDAWWDAWAAGSSEGPDKVVFVAEVNGRAVAMISARVEEDAVHTGALWVGPTWRGRGIADSLLDCIETWAHDVRARVVELDVAEWNEGAIRLYERRHYVDTGRRIHTRHGHDELVMVKPVGT